MPNNPYHPPSSELQKARVATLEESSYVSRVQWRWEIFHLCFAVVIGYVTFVISYSFVARFAPELGDYLSSISEWLNIIGQLTLALSLEIPIALGAVYLAWKITRKWRQFGIGYSSMQAFLVLMLFSREIWNLIPLILISLIAPTALAAMFATRRLRGIHTTTQTIDQTNQPHTSRE